MSSLYLEVAEVDEDVRILGFELRIEDRRYVRREAQQLRHQRLAAAHQPQQVCEGRSIVLHAAGGGHGGGDGRAFGVHSDELLICLRLHTSRIGHH